MQEIYTRIEKAILEAPDHEWRQIDDMPYLHIVEEGKPSPKGWQAPVIGRFDYSKGAMRYVEAVQPIYMKKILDDLRAIRENINLMKGALESIASGNSDPDTMVALAQAALEELA